MQPTALLAAAERQIVRYLESKTRAGTRVPIQALIDYLAGSETIDDFLAGFPTVKREQVVAFLEEATARMVAHAS